MSDKADKLVPIAFDYLYEGMEVLDDIYNFNGRIVLLRRGAILDANKLYRIKKFNSDRRNIYVMPSMHESLREHRNLQESFSQSYLEKEVGYTHLRDAVGDFLFEAKYVKQIESKQVNELQDEISKKVEHVDPVDLFQCINAPRPLDQYLQRHSINVGIINGLMAKWLGMSPEDSEALVLVGLTHDIGKTKIPFEILDAPRKLTPEEYEVIKQHPVYSYELLGKEGVFEERVRQGVRQHHERLGGEGYPDAISGRTISDFARITAISDVYDAMVSQRSYKISHSPFSILSQFKNQEFHGMDEYYLSVFLRNMPAQFIDKSVLMSDGTIAVIKHVLPNDLEHPILDIDGKMCQSSDDWYCVKIIIEDPTFDDLEEFKIDLDLD